MKTPTLHWAWRDAPYSACGRLKLKGSPFGIAWTDNPSERGHVTCSYCRVAIREAFLMATLEKDGVRSLSKVGLGCFRRGFRAGWGVDACNCPYSSRGRSRVNRECWSHGFMTARRIRVGLSR